MTQKYVPVRSECDTLCVAGEANCSGWSAWRQRVSVSGEEEERMASSTGTKTMTTRARNTHSVGHQRGAARQSAARQTSRGANHAAVCREAEVVQFSPRGAHGPARVHGGSRPADEWWNDTRGVKRLWSEERGPQQEREAAADGRAKNGAGEQHHAGRQLKRATAGSKTSP